MTAFSPQRPQSLPPWRCLGQAFPSARSARRRFGSPKRLFGRVLCTYCQFYFLEKDDVRKKHQSAASLPTGDGTCRLGTCPARNRGHRLPPCPLPPAPRQPGPTSRAALHCELDAGSQETQSSFLRGAARRKLSLITIFLQRSTPVSTHRPLLRL